MKRLLTSFVLFFACSLMAQQPILRNAMTTNVAGTPVISQNNLSVTNSVAGGTTNWLFYGTAPNTVARLVDIALGAGTLWATVVTNVDGSVTISTNATVVGTNIYGLSVTNYVLFTSNKLYFYSETNWTKQTGSANLTNWSLLATNTFDWKYQPGSVNLSNWTLLPTNVFDWKYQAGNGILTNISITGALTNVWAVQYGDTDLTNWGLLPTNVFDWKYQTGDSDLTNWSLLTTNVFDWKYQAGDSDLTNWSLLATNTFDSKYQAGSATLTNWSTLPTNKVLWTNISTGLIYTNGVLAATNTGGSGAPWATIVSNANGTITVYTNSGVTGTNIYGLAVADPLTLTEIDAQTLAFTNVIGTFTNANNFGTNKPGVAGQFLTSDGGYLYWSSIDQSFGQAWFVWGSSNTLATNASGVAYKAMQKSDVTLPATPNTNTYTTPTAGQYVGEVITAIPAGVTAILPGDINTVSFIYLSENRTMVLQPEIYVRTNMIAPSWSALGEREVAVGPTFTVNNVFTPYTISVAITTNVPLSVTNYLVRKYKVISVSGGTPNALFVSQGQYPSRVTFPIGSASFVLKSGDTMSGNLILPTAIATTSLIVTGSVISGNSQTSTVVNAQWNTLDNVSIGATISGGTGNSINGTASSWAFLGGGNGNSIVNGAEASIIVGGENNTIQNNNTFGFIGGGANNSIDSGTYGIVLGGSENNINGGDWNTILGGTANEIADATGYSVLSGGRLNRILGEYGSIIGGYLNTNASGSYGTILGGFSNRVAGNYTVAAGALSSAAAAGSWMISDSSQTNKVNSTADSFKAKFSGGYYLGGGNVTLEGTIDYSLQSGVNSNQVITVNAATNLCATNVLVDVGITWNTNAWTTDAAAANPTNWDVNMNPNVGGQRLLMSTNVNITNVVGAASGQVKSKTFILEGAANRTLRVPESWRTSDGSRLYYVTNVGIFTVQTFGTFYTNAVFRNFY